MGFSGAIILQRYPLSQPDGCQLSQRESQGVLPDLPAKLQFREQHIILYLISYISYLKKGCPGRHPLVNQISMITGRIMGLRLVDLYR